MGIPILSKLVNFVFDKLLDLLLKHIFPMHIVDHCIELELGL